MKKILLSVLLIAFLFISVVNSQSAEGDESKEIDKKVEKKKAYLTRRELTNDEDIRVWNKLIPKLGTGFEYEMKDARKELVKIGLPVVKHLVYALNSKKLLGRLADKDKLMMLQSNILSDVRKWYLRIYKQYSSNEIMGKIKTFIDGGTENKEGESPDLVSCRSSKQIFNVMKKIYDVIDEYNVKDSTTSKIPELKIFNKLRGHAALAIGEMGDMSAGSQVGKLISDNSIYVKIKVFESLGLMGPEVPKSVGGKIYPYLFHENLKVRTYAWTAIRKLDYRQAVVDLIAKFNQIEKDLDADKMTKSDYLKTKKLIIDALNGITLEDFKNHLKSWEKWVESNSNNKNPLGIENPRSYKGLTE
ncbi:MAG: hypothetical protein KAR20_00800 [Candidatus Heimdallarchaeota archaeon]|nr:hypothetical protein [Candidatus Heimdallarchaeota archaeon]